MTNIDTTMMTNSDAANENASGFAKLSVKDSSAIRADLYAKVDGIFAGTEVVDGGILIPVDPDRNVYATLNITVHDASKFDLTDVRAKYAAKLDAAAARAQKAADKAAEKAAKASAKNAD